MDLPDGLDVDPDRPEVAAKHAGAGADLQHGPGAHREHGAELVPVRHPSLAVVVALEVVVLGRDLDRAFAQDHRMLTRDARARAGSTAVT